MGAQATRQATRHTHTHTRSGPSREHTHRRVPTRRSDRIASIRFASLRALCSRRYPIPRLSRFYPTFFDEWSGGKKRGEYRTYLIGDGLSFHFTHKADSSLTHTRRTITQSLKSLTLYTTTTVQYCIVPIGWTRTRRMPRASGRVVCTPISAALEGSRSRRGSDTSRPTQPLRATRSYTTYTRV